jgi:pSer/pThr/pTyr-binding forkhead associated (FHA) protein
MSDTTKTKLELPALAIDDGELKGMYWMLELDSLIIGRDDTCDVVIPSRQVSRQHARLQRVGRDKYQIIDLESRNGTWLNGNKLDKEPRPLSDGDELHITLNIKLKYYAPGTTIPTTQSDLPQVIPSSLPDGRLRLDTETRQVFIRGLELEPPLSLPQYRLLELLFINSVRVCTREEVVEAVWPDALGEGVSEQAIDALVRRLRDRLAEIDPEGQYIATVRGHGFRFLNPLS